MNPIKAIGIAAVALFAFFVAVNSYTTIDRGHVGVKTLFGKVDATELQSGFHIVNPMAKIDEVNIQNSELTLDGVDVPSQDKLLTDVDVTIKWRVDSDMAAESLRDTGSKGALVATHLVPKARSIIRETGKTIEKADHFFQERVQAQMQSAIFNGLKDSLAEKGIVIDEVLIRGIRLPRSVAEGVIATKQREIEGQKQIAELARFKTQEQQKVALAQAEAEAAVQEAEKRKTLADVKAYEITAEATAQAESIKIKGEALKENPELIDLIKAERWDGQLSKFSITSGGSGGGVGMIFDTKSVLADK